MNNAPKIYRFDCDVTGTDSIQSYVESGRVINIECPTFAEFDEQARRLSELIQPGDFFIIDTLSSNLETTRGDLMHGTDAKKSLWEDASKYFGDKNYLNTYKAAQNLNLRRINNLLNRNAHGITVCHEIEGRDPLVEIGGDKMAVPMMNPKMLDDFLAKCTEVFRKTVLTEDKFDERGRKLLQAGQHILYLRRTAQWTAKFHVDPKRRDVHLIPKALIGPVPKAGATLGPTMSDIWEVLGKVPRHLCIYGTPGVGKSTLAASVVDAIDNQHQKQHNTKEKKD